MIQLEPEDYLNKKSIIYNQKEGYINCKFSRARTVANNRWVTDLSKPHYIHIQRGTPSIKNVISNIFFNRFILLKMNKIKR